MDTAASTRSTLMQARPDAPGRRPEPGSAPSVPRWLIGPIRAVARAANPWVLRAAGRPGVPFAVVRHLGRRSGRTYANPVIAFRTRDGFVISLPYGSDASWCRNVLAAGGASVRWHGVEHSVGRPEVLGLAEARPLLPPWLRAVLRVVRLRQFLRVQTVTAPNVAAPATANERKAP